MARLVDHQTAGRVARHSGALYAARQTGERGSGHASAFGVITSTTFGPFSLASEAVAGLSGATDEGQCLVAGAEPVAFEVHAQLAKEVGHLHDISDRSGHRVAGIVSQFVTASEEPLRAVHSNLGGQVLVHADREMTKYPIVSKTWAF